MVHLSENLLTKVEGIIKCDAKIKGYGDLMPYFTTEERGHGEIDHVGFLMQNDGNPPEGGTWAEQHITYEQLQALYNFCQGNVMPCKDTYLKLIREMDKNVLLSFPNVKKGVISKEISSKRDRWVKGNLRKNLREQFDVNRPRFWQLENGDIICQPNRRINKFYQYYTNYVGGYWFSETLMVGDTAIMVKRAW
ncbi:MAG: hypothetical protein J6J36_06105 [Clostridia bacterium]|nr:hypothetical protein [Clostridia bacterium]